MSKKIRILHIIDSLNIGGTEKQCVELIKRIDRSKYMVQLLTFNKNGPLYKDVMGASIPLKEIRIPGSFYRPKSLLQILRIAFFIRKHGFHIVQTYGISSNIPGILAAKISRTPVVVGGKREMNEIWPSRKVAAEMKLLKRCQIIVVNAKKVRDYLILDGGIPDEKIKVIYNGIDLHKYANLPEMDPDFKPITVGMIANFRPQKDHKTFLKAAAEVLKVKTDVRFVFVGSGRFEDSMKNHAKELGIQANVIFYGRKTGKELLDIFRGFTITILSSTNEGFPNVILESMALGIPVIANPSGGVSELLKDGVTGYLFPYRKFEILAKKIIYLIENKHIAEKLGKDGQKYVKEKFRFDLMTSQHEKLYENLFYKNVL